MKPKKAKNYYFHHLLINYYFIKLFKFSFTNFKLNFVHNFN